MNAVPGRAVFLSYASEDAEAARFICETLRAADVAVWFDRSELRGGDAWDGNIRKQIKECALFVPIVSANTQARLEGYFRVEWKLAAQRTHAMAAAKPFLLPVVIDATNEADAHVPEEFRAVHWTFLRPAGFRGPALDAQAVEKFAARVRALLEPSPGGRERPELRRTAPPLSGPDAKARLVEATESKRRILIEGARNRLAQGRGGRSQHANIGDLDLAAAANDDESVLQVNEALEKFALAAPEKATLVHLRYFGGLTLPQVAEALDMDERTARRWWDYARAWLVAEIKRSAAQ